MSRLFQVAQMGVLVAAVGGESGLWPAFLGQGVSFVGTTAGDLVPAQLGVTDAAFALSATLLRISRTDSLALALLGHVTLLTWVGIAALAPLALGSRARTRGCHTPETRWSSQPSTLGHP